MPDAYCQPCRERGRMTTAEHIVAGTLMCDSCFRGQEKPLGGTMANRITGEQLDAIWATLPAEKKAALINKLPEL